MTDHAFATTTPDDPGIQTFNAFYGGRNNTTMVPRLVFESLEGLVDHLDGLPANERPIGDLFICSHGNESGWLKIRMTSILPVREVDYDVLVQYGGRLALNPATVTPPAGGQPGTTVRFRACRIGQADAFMRLLKQSFGGPRVSAAKHFFEYGSGSINGQAIAYEYLAYGFLISVPEAASLQNRAAVVQAFRNYRRPVTNDPFTYYNNVAIPPGAWDGWIPEAAPRHKTSREIHRRLAAGDPLFNFKIEFRNERTQAPDAIPFPGAQPAQPAARAAALAHLQTLPGYQPPPGNPYPVYERNGFASLQAFVDGHTWTRTEVSGVPGLVGARREYTLLVPIFDPATNLVLHNLTPGNRTGPPAARVGLDENDARLFWNQ